MSATPNINPAKVIGNVLNKFDATAAPTVNDDTSTGFSVGSTWIDVTNDKAYNCVDATTGAAVWNEAGGGGGIYASGAWIECSAEVCRGSRATVTRSTAL